MLINLLPDFFQVLESTDRIAAYNRYIASHGQLLTAYWRNYVIDPEGLHFRDIVVQTVGADRSDLRMLVERTDVASLVRRTEATCRQLLEADVDVDIVLMVGVGAANAGELVVDGQGIAFVCLEHFTGVTNRSTQGLGLDPELIPLWIAHEYAHAVRYTSPTSRSQLRDIIAAAGGNYSYWETGRRATLRELLINEGLAVQFSRLVSPGHAEWVYYGYERRQYARVRELESLIARAAAHDMENPGLGLRLRYLSGGMSDESRTMERYVVPERSGYYLGARMCRAAIAALGFPWSIRAASEEICALDESAAA
jgi:hypothetical protein